MRRIRIAALAAVAAALTVPAAAPAATEPATADSWLLDIQAAVMQAASQQVTLLDQQQLSDLSMAVNQRIEQIRALQYELDRLLADPVANAAQIEALEQQIQALRSQLQMELLRLQSLYSTYDQNVSVTSNIP